MKILNNFQLLMIAISLAVATSSIISNVAAGESYGWQIGVIVWIFNYYRIAKAYDNIFKND